MTKKIKKGLVWTFYKPHSDHKNYLIGTMHVRDERAFHYEAVFNRAILSASIFATELDLDAAALADTQSVMAFEPPVSLQTVLSEKLYTKTNQCVQRILKLDLAFFNHLKPVFLTNLLAEAVLSNDRVLPLDAVLWSFAKENGRILRGIESLESQLALVQAMRLDEQVKALKDCVSHFSRFRKRLLGMARFYESGDLKALYKAAKRSAKGQRRALIYDRNQLMLAAIQALVAEDTLCAAVGAGHLGGKKGLLQLLRAAGYIVEPFK